MINYNYASIDVGSNSINLLLALVENRKIVYEETRSFITGLGSGLKDKGEFSFEGMARAKTAFKEISDLIKKYNIPSKNVRCVATEASRVAKNSGLFFSEIKNLFSIETEIISADDEAKFSVAGVVDNDVNEAIVIDFGGASTEIIHIKGKMIKGFKSFQIGSVNVSKYFKEELLKSFVKDFGNRLPVILVGGTAATFASMLLGQTSFNSKLINEKLFTLEEISTFRLKLEIMSIDVICETYPTAKPRRESIKEGINRLCSVVELVGSNRVRFSTRGVRHGVMLGAV